MVYLKPYDSVQQPRVSRYYLNTLLCIFWNSSDALQGRLKEMSLMVTPYVCKTMLVSTRQIKENYFASLNFYACRHSPYSPGMAANYEHSFRSLQQVLAEKLVNEEMETCLNH